jgi:hypothetical protein
MAGHLPGPDIDWTDERAVADPRGAVVSGASHLSERLADGGD